MLRTLALLLFSRRSSWRRRPHAAITASTITSPASGTELFLRRRHRERQRHRQRHRRPGPRRMPRAISLCYTVSDTRSFERSRQGIDDHAAARSRRARRCCRSRGSRAGSRSSPTGQDADRRTPPRSFAGPAISVSDQFSHSSAGNMFGYFILSGTLPWSYAFQSLGECPVNSSFATDPSTLGSFSLFVGNGCLLAVERHRRGGRARARR